MSLATLASEALDASWRINVSGQVYGPYTGHQIRAFAAEGRIAPHSIVQSGEGPWITAIDDPILAQLFVGATSFGARIPSTATANLVVIADIRSRGSAPFEAAIVKLGDAFRFNGLVWLLNTDRTAGAVRNELIQHIGSSDNLLVIDATRGSTAMSNLGPEIEAKVRRVWKRQAEKAHS